MDVEIFLVASRVKKEAISQNKVVPKKIDYFGITSLICPTITISQKKPSGQKIATLIIPVLCKSQKMSRAPFQNYPSLETKATFKGFRKYYKKLHFISLT